MKSTTFQRNIKENKYMGLLSFSWIGRLNITKMFILKLILDWLQLQFKFQFFSNLVKWVQISMGKKWEYLWKFEKKKKEYEKEHFLLNNKKNVILVQESPDWPIGPNNSEVDSSIHKDFAYNTRYYKLVEKGKFINSAEKLV